MMRIRGLDSLMIVSNYEGPKPVISVEALCDLCGEK